MSEEEVFGAAGEISLFDLCAKLGPERFSEFARW
jgi:hypothetical protein